MKVTKIKADLYICLLQIQNFGHFAFLIWDDYRRLIQLQMM